MNHRQAWSKLDEYLDGALPAEERWAVAAHLSECEACREQLAKLARMREIARAHLAAVELPAQLEDRLRSALAAEATPASIGATLPWSPPVLLRLAAVLALLVAGVWLLTRAFAPVVNSPATLRTEVTLAHALFAQDKSKLDVVGDASDVAAWFRAEAGFNPSIPDVAGYTLSGARLIVFDGQAVAQLVYQRDTDSAYLSLLRFKNRGVDLTGTDVDGGYAVSQQGETSLVTWTKGDDRTVLIGELSPTEIRRLADDLATRPDVSPAASPADEGTPNPDPASRWSRYDDY